MKDLISRQAAIDAIESAKTARTPDGEIYVVKLNAEMNIQILPSAEKRGKWIHGEDGLFACSVCGGEMVRNVFPHCPWCGAKMEGEVDG